jgi:hypothetical protein
MENVSKQDRVASRTTADLERRYQFGRSFAEAEQRVEDLDKSLDPEGVFDRLTDSGKAKGLTRDEKGNLFFNADFVNAGKLSGITLRAEDEYGNYVAIERGRIYAGNKSTPFFSILPSTTDPGIFVLHFDNEDSDGLRIGGSMCWNRIDLGRIEQEEGNFVVEANIGAPGHRGTVLIRLPALEDHFGEPNADLYAYWKKNEDGSYSIVGYEDEIKS